ncbi:type VI secretion system accessory protein TagJ [Roseibium algae]|uniref:Type VI secretion system accessory protein TagJ n=1 Tax=Roseibium algae TaxID=3123038 RepID=A0ABU8TE91_9HYPH
MTADELLKQGALNGALAALQDRVRKAPEDPRLRVFLFQLLCVLGQWQRAIVQLKTCATLDPKSNSMAQMYRTAIICEVQREKVLRAEKQPMIFGEPEDWVAWMVEALKHQAQGDLNAAEDLRAQAFETAPAIPGMLNGVPFNWIADADPRLGPILELMVNGRYFWAPFTAISRIVMEPPTDLRDRVWMPATITWSNGGDAIALIPTRYAGTAEAASEQHLLAGTTEWLGDGEHITAGLGQRLLTTDAEDCGLMDLRELQLLPTVTTSNTDQMMVSDDG